jgi:hypothetical protein
MMGYKLVHLQRLLDPAKYEYLGFRGDLNIFTNPKVMLRFFEQYKPQWATSNSDEALIWLGHLDKMKSIVYDSDDWDLVNHSQLSEVLPVLSVAYDENLGISFAQHGFDRSSGDLMEMMVGYLTDIVEKLAELEERQRLPDEPWVAQLSSRIIFFCMEPLGSGGAPSPMLSPKMLDDVLPMLSLFPYGIREVSVANL